MPISEKHKERVRTEAERTRKTKHKAMRGGVLLIAAVVGVLYLIRLLTTGSAAEQAKVEPSATPPPLVGEEADLALLKEELPWNLLVVSSDSPLPRDFTVSLETVPGGRVDTRCAEDLRAMLAQAKMDGVTISVTSAYRNVSKQKQLYERDIAGYIKQGYSENDAEAETKRHIQPPGASEHHTGLAVDLITPAYQVLNEGFANTEAYRWLSAHASEYGFILRYPENKVDLTGIDFEPWHYRYVGKPDAREITASGLCLEEYVASRKADAFEETE